MRDSLEQMRRELGDEAIILSSREIHEPGNFPITEVVAGIEPEELEFHRQRQRVPSAIVHAAGEKRPELYSPRVIRDANVELQHPQPSPRIAQSASTDTLMSEIRALKEAVRELRQHQPQTPTFIPSSLLDIQETLNAVGFSANHSRRLLEGLFQSGATHDKEEMLRLIREELMSGLRCANPLRPSQQAVRVLVIGAPGSGKSTLLAKLATSFALTLNARSLVLNPTHSPYPLRSVTGLECREYDTFEAVDGVCEQSSNIDFEFVEMAIPSVSKQTNEDIQRAILATRASVVLCCVSSAHHPAIQEAWIQLGSSLEHAAVVLSQLDCHALPGSTLELLTTTQLPVAFITDGQSIPQSIKAATPERLVGAVLK